MLEAVRYKEGPRIKPSRQCIDTLRKVVHGLYEALGGALRTVSMGPLQASGSFGQCILSLRRTRIAALVNVGSGSRRSNRNAAGSVDDTYCRYASY